MGFVMPTVNPDPGHPDVTAVIPNWNGGALLHSALASLAGQTGVSLETIVVDNGSDPAELRTLAEVAPWARIVSLGRNRGFALGCNTGIRQAKARFVLTLNNDARLAPDYCARLVSLLDADGDLAAAQGLVLDGEGLRVDSAGIVWSERGEALQILNRQPLPEIDRPFSVAGVSATAAVYRVAAISSLDGGLFDEGLFAYYEDADASLRLLRAGWQFACDPGARAWHVGASTGRRTPFRRDLWLATNRWRVLGRNFAPGFLRRQLPSLLRADLAHARHCGLPGGVLLIAVIPTILRVLTASSRSRSLLGAWPRLGCDPLASGPPSSPGSVRVRR